MSEENKETIAIEGVEGATATVQDQHNPEDIAAVFFQREKPRLKNLLSGMSVKQMRRFVMHVAAYPLTDPGDIPRTEAEKRAAYLFNEMVTNRTIMQLAMEMQKVQNANIENNNEGENNGEET